MRRLFPISSMFCLVLIAPCLAAAPEGDLGARLEGYRADWKAIVLASADEDDWDDHGAAFEDAYERWFPADSFGTLIENAEKPELTGLFFETLGNVWYVGRKSEHPKVQAVFAGLEAKGWADDRIIEYMHQFLLEVRRFDAAKAFRQAHPHQDLRAPPPVVPPSSFLGESGRTVLRITGDGAALERQTIDLQSSSQVIVIGHPGCHFCQDAVAAITADPELAEAMGAAGLWLTAPSTSLVDGSVAEWNREYPAYAYRYVESKADWPEVTYWGTPSFYFMKDGELVKKLVGWPEGGRMEDLRAGLRAIGIAVAE